MKKRQIKIEKGLLELLGEGNQFVACGSHSSGARYQWQGGLPTEIPTVTMAALNQTWSELTSRFAMNPSTSKTIVEPTSVGPASQALTEIDDETWHQLIEALKYLLPHAEENETWSAIGYALLSIQKTRPACTLWIDFSKKAKGYEPGAPEAWWDAHKDQTPRSDYRHIFSLARHQGWGRTSEASEFAVITGSGEASAAAESAVRSGETEGSEDPTGSLVEILQSAKPFIRLSDAALDTNVGQLDLLLSPTVFTQGDELIRLSRAHDAEVVDGVKRAADQLVLARVTKGWARTHAMGECDFYRFDKRKRAGEEWVKCSCPDELVNVWMDQGDWPKLKPLDAIARAPFVRADGSICDTTGYDAGSHALYIPSEAYPAIPEAPTRADARSALDGIRRVFDQFPWETPASESAFLAHVLTEAARLAVDRVPMFWYSAPNAGTGKSLLSEMAAIIVHGTEPALRPWVQNGDELRKTLFASLLAGDRSIAFDNVPTGHKARAPELCAFLTSAVWKDRKLGVSETHAVPNRVVVSASGNNVTPVSDLARRCLVVRLDANTERMKERRFKIDNLRGYVMAHRAQLLVHALTIIKAYHIAPTVYGFPVPLPSFERWSRMVRDPLLWLELPDPCETQSETDDETGSLGETFEKLVAHFGEREFTAMDIASMVGGVADSRGELTNLLLQSGCSEPHSALKVGYWLRGERGKISAGFKLVRGGRSSQVNRFQFKRVNEDLS